ncbi:MAG: nuclear transport factor 2 family protein [Chthoniobacter sp.]|nr:nuclear transport factor 2 family protein [Chthoniobacter sp.]
MTTAYANAASEKIGIDLVRHCFAAYVAKDQEALEAMLAADFTFSSPLDDHISRAEYFARCWPNSEKMDTVHLEQTWAEGDEVFVLYLCEQTDGKTFRNIEHFKIEGRKVKSVNVYFGREVTSGATTNPATFGTPDPETPALVASSI